MDTETASKMVETIRSLRLQLRAIDCDLAAIERAVASEAPGDE